MMTVVGGTYVGEGTDHSAKWGENLGNAIGGVADQIKREKIANAQALVAQVEALNAQYGALAFHPPLALSADSTPEERAHYDNVQAEYQQRLNTLGAAAQALKEAGGIKDPESWAKAYITGPYTQKQAGLWTGWQRPPATPVAPPAPDTQHGGGGTKDAAIVAGARQATVAPAPAPTSRVPQSGMPPFPQPLMDAVAPPSSVLGALNIGAGVANMLLHPEVYSSNYRARVGLDGKAPAALAPTQAPVPAVTTDFVADPVSKMKEIKYFIKDQSGRVYGGPFNTRAEADASLAAALPNRAGGTGAPRQLSPEELAAYEKRTGDIHYPALVGVKEGIINARAMAQPGVAKAVRDLNSKVPAYAGGKGAGAPTSDQSAAEANMEWFREQMRQRGPVPRVPGGEYSTDPKVQRPGVFDPRYFTDSVPMPTYADGYAPGMPTSAQAEMARLEAIRAAQAGAFNDPAFALAQHQNGDRKSVV
jgi:hypothetical protein